MQRLRFIAVVLGASALAATAALALGGGATTTRADGQHTERWWRPPRGRAGDAAGRLAAQPRALRPRARRLRHAPHALVQDDRGRGIGAARDWIKAEFDRIAATTGGRMRSSCRATSRSRPTASRRPTRITNVVATLRGTDPALGRPRVRRRRALRLARDRRPERHERRAGRERRRLGHLGGARAGARDGAGADRGDDRLRRLRGRGAGPVRLDALRRAGEAERLEHPGRAQHGHHRQPERRQRRARPARDPAVLRGRADERDAGRDRAAAVASAARTTASRASSRATSRRPARTARPA